MSSPRISALTTGMSRSAAMEARAKNDMKPSPMPCCFWKRSLCSARSAITSLMSISLKVVRIAAVRCAWTRRSAIRRRMGLIGTRSSPSTRAADGVGAAGTSIRTGRALRSRYASTSSLVSRPPLPDAGTRVGSRSCSARRRRTAGLSGPTARAAGSSMLALSVSSSSRTSSGLTASPSCFAQRTMTPSVTDSPSVGMRTSNVMPPSASAPVSAGQREVHQVALLGQVQLERAGRGARGEELVVDLAAAEEDAPHPAVLDRDPGLGRAAERDVVDHGPEPALRQLLERRDAQLMAEEALRGHQHERLPEAPVHLAAEDVEVLRRRGQVADLHVVLGAELEEALEARARVLGALALVAVREEQHEAAHALPLRLRAGEELVDDHLRAVDEVAELRLPEDQPAGVGEAHAELEAEYGVLGQHAVDDAEGRLVAPDVVERNVPVAGLDVVEDGVALAEGAAAGVLPAHPDRDAPALQPAEGEWLVH